jgi:hypothetical protein
VGPFSAFLLCFTPYLNTGRGMKRGRILTVAALP